jgi:hypothetical protein
VIAEIELVMIETNVCPACGRRHRLRIALAGPTERDDGLLGSFSLCPVTGRRVWLVAPLPLGHDGESLLIASGPPDDADWTPVERDESPAAGWRGAPPARVPPRGHAGGVRDRQRTPELLRRVLGCPIT